MSTAPEKVNIIIMRDNGETRRLRIRRSSLRWFTVFCCVTPCLAVLGIGMSITLWQERSLMQQRITILEHSNESNRAKAERLGTLEVLLQQDPGTKNTIVHKAQENVDEKTSKETASATKPDKTSQNTSENIQSMAQEAAKEAGPGHADFPVVDTGQVGMGNVQARILSQNRLRVALDLRNMHPPHSISGDITCILGLSSGEAVPLALTPKDVGFFKIQHWKRAVLFAPIDAKYDLTNAQVLIEVKTSDDTLVYRNIYDIEQ